MKNKFEKMWGILDKIFFDCFLSTISIRAKKQKKSELFIIYFSHNSNLQTSLKENEKQ